MCGEILLANIVKGTPGFTRAPIENKMAFRHHDHGQLFFRDRRVPKTNQVGGFGMRAAFANVEHTRFGIACAAVGAIQACLDQSVNYCKDRKQFKRPIASFQLVQDKIADMVIALMQRNEFGVPAYARATLLDASWVPGRTVRKAP